MLSNNHHGISSRDSIETNLKKFAIKIPMLSWTMIILMINFHEFSLIIHSSKKCLINVLLHDFPESKILDTRRRSATNPKKWSSKGSLAIFNGQIEYRRSTVLSELNGGNAHLSLSPSPSSDKRFVIASSIAPPCHSAVHRCLIYQLRSQHPKVGSSYADRTPCSFGYRLKDRTVSQSVINNCEVNCKYKRLNLKFDLKNYFRFRFVIYQVCSIHRKRSESLAHILMYVHSQTNFAVRKQKKKRLTSVFA